MEKLPRPPASREAPFGTKMLNERMMEWMAQRFLFRLRTHRAFMLKGSGQHKKDFEERKTKRQRRPIKGGRRPHPDHATELA